MVNIADAMLEFDDDTLNKLVRKIKSVAALEVNAHGIQNATLTRF
jgi:hypothetical protein